jgi:hypothetical protein
MCKRGTVVQQGPGVGGVDVHSHHPGANHVKLIESGFRDSCRWPKLGLLSGSRFYVPSTKNCQASAHHSDRAVNTMCSRDAA